MDNRREFLKSTLGVVAANFGAGAKSLGLFPSIGAVSTGELPRPEHVLDIQRMKPRGQFEEATIPETLDLAERARLSIHNLTHNLDPNNHYYVWQTIKFGPPAEEHSKGPEQVGGVARGTRGRLAFTTSVLTPKNARALPWLRTMSGSDECLDREYGMMKAMMDNVRDDGLMYQPADTLDQQKDTAGPLTNGILALAYENHYALDGNPLWLDWIERLASGLKRIAIRVDDRAYYPGECNLTPEGQWVWHLRGASIIPYKCTDEPFMDAQGVEAVKLYHGYQMRALVRAYKYKGDQDALDLSRRIVRFELKPWMWENTTLEGVQGNEHGVFYGHFHGHVMNLLALLDVAEADNNTWLKEFVREGYHDAVRHGVVRMGWFPCWVMPTKYGRDIGHFGDLQSINENCGTAEMAELGVRLSDAGLGDYWDDVDGIARNQLAEHQFCNVAAMRDMCKGALRVEDYYGGFGVGSPTGIDPQMYGCCSANGAIGLYYVWHGITRFRDGVATVNLFLNRASAWMDVNSYLPYEGKVELHNKQAKTALVRVPEWVDMGEVKSFVNDKAVRPEASGRYLIFDGLQKGATVRLKFPNPETVEHYTINGQRYQLTFRGSTVVDIEPRSKDRALVDWDKGIYFPLYQRSAYRSDKTPMSTVRRFVAENALPLQ